MGLNILRQLGSGRIRLRLVIEGWPAEFVSDASITHANGADGRDVIPGLQQAGLRMVDRLILREAGLDTAGMTFTITPDEPVFVNGAQTDRVMLALSTYPEPVSRLNEDLTYDSTSIPDADPLLTAVYPSGGIAHIGTEAIRVVDGIERHIWDTQAQAHPISLYDQTFNPYIYAKPPTMEGRRAFLYGYDDGDDPAEDGSCIWRGIVMGPPKLASDGVSWQIETQGITQVLNQQIAGRIQEAHVVGIYHHATCAAAWIFRYNGLLSTVSGSGDAYKYSGHDLNEATMIANINTAIAASITDFGIPGVTELSLRRGANGALYLKLRTSASWDTGDSLTLTFASPILGGSKGTKWIDNVSGKEHDEDDLAVSTEYVMPIEQGNYLFDGIDVLQYEGAPVSPLGDAKAIMAVSAFGTTQSKANYWVDNDAVSTAPPFRIYIDQDFSGVELVHISGTFKPGGLFEVTATGDDSGKYYIEVAEWSAPFGLYQDPNNWAGNDTNHASQGFLGWLGDGCIIRAARNFGVGSVATFIESLKTHGRDYGNAGDVPVITDADFVAATIYNQFSNMLTARVYQFFQARSLLDVLTQEFLLVGFFPRLTIAGKIELKELPSWTNATQVTSAYTLDSASIITPDENSGAEFPGYEPNIDGIVTQCTVQHLHDDVADSWIDREDVFQDQRQISISKTKGTSPLAIKAFSSPLLMPGPADNLIFRQRIAERYLSVFGVEYQVVTLCVAWTRFDVLLGEIVSITSPHIPDGDGYRGVTARRAVVIGREWPLDGAEEAFGKLTVLLTPRGIVGYAPSAAVASADNPSGDHWVFTCDSGDTLNTYLASTSDGAVLVHFTVGDRVRIFLNDDTDGSSYALGTVESVDLVAETIGVLLDATAPGSWSGSEDMLMVEFSTADDGISDSQKQYAFIADATNLLDDGSFARRYA